MKEKNKRETLTRMMNVARLSANFTPQVYLIAGNSDCEICILQIAMPAGNLVTKEVKGKLLGKYLRHFANRYGINNLMDHALTECVLALVMEV